jgi:hypothetical protein
MDAARGKVQIDRFNQRVPYKMSKEEWAAFEKAKKRGYAVIAARGYQALENVWFEWTKMHGLPYAKVKVRRAYAEVSVDLITTSYGLGVLS